MARIIASNPNATHYRGWPEKRRIPGGGATADGSHRPRALIGNGLAVQRKESVRNFVHTLQRTRWADRHSRNHVNPANHVNPVLSTPHTRSGFQIKSIPLIDIPHLNRTKTVYINVALRLADRVGQHTIARVCAKRHCITYNNLSFCLR